MRLRGLGSAAANTLVRAGVGTVRIVDRDVVELSNLQRQVLFDEEDARPGLPKAIAAAEKLRTVNSEVAVEPIVANVDHANVERFCDGVDVMIDGTDNFETRFLFNDAAVQPRPAVGLRRLRGRRGADDDHRAGPDALPAMPVARLPAAGQHAHVRYGRHPRADRERHRGDRGRSRR